MQGEWHSSRLEPDESLLIRRGVLLRFPGRSGSANIQGAEAIRQPRVHLHIQSAVLQAGDA